MLAQLRAEGLTAPDVESLTEEQAKAVEAVLRFPGASGEASASPVLINVLPVPPVRGWNSLARIKDERGSGARDFDLYVPPVATGTGLLGSAFKPAVEPRQLAAFLRDRGWLAGREKVLGRGQAGNPVYTFVSRLTDIGFAAAVLLFLWWLLIGIMAAIRFDSRGPAIFAQVRVGRFGAPFTCYKFRTMRTGTPHVATHEVASAAVTRLGSFLRRTKLDELPQVWNLLKGELSLVGPRPCLPAQTALVEARRRAGVLEVRPGITGLAQVHGVDMSDPEWLATYDARYVAIQSLSVDWRIMVDTALGKGSQDRVRL